MVLRTILIFFIWILNLVLSIGQKYDNIWLMGYQATIAPDDSLCISIFDFSTDTEMFGCSLTVFLGNDIDEDILELLRTFLAQEKLETLRIERMDFKLKLMN